MAFSMGLPWIFESLHYSVHKNHETAEICQSALETFFGIMSILNCSRGIIMFFLFVCKKSVWSKLERTEPFKKLNRKLKKREERKSVMSATTFISMSSMGNVTQKRLTNASMN